MSAILEQLRERSKITRQLISGHVRYCEECADSVKEDRKANCVVGVNLVITAVQTDEAIKAVDKWTLEGHTVRDVEFHAEGFVLKGDMA